MIDFASGFPKRASSRLRKQIIVWLTTVAINLNSDPDGDEVTVMLGVARILPSWPKGPRVDQYLRKYRAGMKALGFTSDTFKAEYNAPIEVTPTEVRGF